MSLTIGQLVTEDDQETGLGPRCCFCRLQDYHYYCTMSSYAAKEKLVGSEFYGEQNINNNGKNCGERARHLPIGWLAGLA